MTAQRGLLVAANWKMHLLRREAEAVIGQWVAAPLPEGTSAVVFPSFSLLPAVVAALTNTTITVGGQDLHPEPAGAHTGDVSGEQLRDAGCRWVLIGHSERRRDHDEDDALVARKTAAALRSGLIPMICVGETEAQRLADQTEEVLLRQVDAVLEVLSDAPTTEFALAYEPVWAIGTGASAQPEQAQEAHRILRARVVERLGRRVAESLRILYGGSVKPENAGDLARESDVDGFLVGGASLDAEKFLAIIARSARVGSGAPRRQHL